MSTPLLPDALWNLIQPLLPPSPRRPKGGRPRLSHRACLTVGTPKIQDFGLGKVTAAARAECLECHNNSGFIILRRGTE